VLVAGLLGHLPEAAGHVVAGCVAQDVVERVFIFGDVEGGFADYDGEFALEVG
jgi:hypothetical protein